ncbi:hypothetical protein [Enterobacter sp. Bisph1]|uniref:hypothetical protein n=1 Tax=Enterobacter sp. Bisph1 TaxID=1274399 RepID=UPI00057BFF6D|nr:hypothetical protein [Enterobacter sp. Bisph1]
MSKREDILDGREYKRKYDLIYTEVLCWIDLGHAHGTDIVRLLKQINDGEVSGAERYEVSYSQSMRDPTRTINVVSHGHTVAYYRSLCRTVRLWDDFRSGIVTIISHNGNYIDKAKGGNLPYA